MPPDAHCRDLIRQLQAMIARTGRRYQIDLEALDVASLRDLQRLLRDLEDDRRRVVQQARLFPWKSP